jgi:hypothetical protein
MTTKFWGKVEHAKANLGLFNRFRSDLFYSRYMALLSKQVSRYRRMRRSIRGRP